MPKYDLIIVGAGPSGISCAIEASKAGLNYLVLEKGLLANSIYHFPTNMTFFSTSLKLEIGDIPFISHSDKPTRMEALEYYRRLYEHYELKVSFQDEVHSIEQSEDGFQVNSKKASYLADHLILSTGYYDVPRLLDIPGESLAKVKHYYDDAHPYIGQDIVVVGGANSACDVALETWQKGANVTMVVRKAELYQRVKYWLLPNIENRIKEGSIKAYFSSELKEIRSDQVDIQTPEGQITIPNDVVLSMTGYMPDYDFLSGVGLQFSEDENRVPVHNPETLESNIPGMYIAGVINAGLQTSKLFIENTRDHGGIIIQDILSKLS